MRFAKLLNLILLTAFGLTGFSHDAMSQSTATAHIVPSPQTTPSISQVITLAATTRIEKTLSADDMQGRASFTPGIEKAADFIETQFKAAGLRTWDKGKSYRQPFLMIRTRAIAVSGSFEGQPLDSAQIAVVSDDSLFSMDEESGYEKVHLRSADHLTSDVQRMLREDKNLLVLVDTSLSKDFRRLTRYQNRHFGSDHAVVFVLSQADPTHYSIRLRQQVEVSRLANVVGILPGRSKPGEYVIFSGHYDHLGIGKPDSRGDSIYNGANDDASGTTAVILLARYFSQHRNNARTLVFAAFTAEEIGEYGSQYFSQRFDPDSVTAMFNIEMIGTQSKWGKNSAFITGYERSDMGAILEKNLKGSPFHFYPDPYPQEQLFYRSDNASLARLGVPAHTISTSKMDSEKYYHTQADEIGTLDLVNMVRIIRSIAISSRTIVRGIDTPHRVDTTTIR